VGLSVVIRRKTSFRARSCHRSRSGRASVTRRMAHAKQCRRASRAATVVGKAGVPVGRQATAHVVAYNRFASNTLSRGSSACLCKAHRRTKFVSLPGAPAIWSSPSHYETHPDHRGSLLPVAGLPAPALTAGTGPARRRKAMRCCQLIAKMICRSYHALHQTSFLVGALMAASSPDRMRRHS
jgi:hypothetical protein